MTGGLRVGRRSTVLIALAACLAAVGVGPVSAVSADRGRAVASTRTQQITESGQLRLLSRHGTNVWERGTAKGTYNGTLWLQIKAEENNLYFSFQFRNRLGEISGSGHIRLRVANPRSTMSGTASAMHGTGHFAHISAPHLQVSGSIVTSTYATTLQVRGAMRL